MLRHGPYALSRAVIKARSGSWERAEDGHLTKVETGEGVDHFPEKATPELSAAECLNTSQAKGLRKMLEEEKRSPWK